VAFRVGGIELGDGVAGPYMNPIEIAYATDIFEYKPTNMARFLQTIDDDDLTSNGILITEAVRTAAVGKTLDFDQHHDAFAADANVQQVVSDLTSVTTAGTRTLVDYTTARAHLRATLLSVHTGLYFGTFDRGDGNKLGNWDFTAAPDGSITGSFKWQGQEIVHLIGDLQPSGSFTCNGEGVLNLLFTGKIGRGADGRHDVVGAWSNYDQDSGVLNGEKGRYLARDFDCK